MQILTATMIWPFCEKIYYVTEDPSLVTESSRFAHLESFLLLLSSLSYSISRSTCLSLNVKPLHELLVMDTSKTVQFSQVLSRHQMLMPAICYFRSQETGLPVSVRIQVANRIFNLKVQLFTLLQYPLFSKSGYFKRNLNDSNEIELPQDFPRGPETFETIALFIYSSSTLVDPFNVATLRCAAQFLEMTEEYGSGNLCEHFDIYLNHVVLQSWDAILIVLQKCQTLLPWTEELQIVIRCIESLAFMACMEILDPERRRYQPVVTLEAFAGQAWCCEKVKEILRRQGMKEKYVSPIVAFYVNKWVLSKKMCQFWESSGENDEKTKVSVILRIFLNSYQRGRRLVK